MAPVGFRKLVEPVVDGNTIARMHEKSGVARSTVERWVNRMHADGECHIGAWERSSGAMAPVYRMGPGKDQPQPGAMTGAEYCRRHRAKLRVEDRYDTFLARRRAGRTIANAKAGKLLDPITAAICRRAA